MSWTPSQVAGAEKWLKSLGDKYGQDWAKDSSAASRISSTPLSIGEAIGAGVSKGLDPTPDPVVRLGAVKAKPHYPHVPGGSTATDPYAASAARAAARKAVAAVDQHIIRNIPFVASLFGPFFTTTLDVKRREVAQEKLKALGSAPTDAMQEAKYRSKLFPEVANELESALKEVRLAIQYFENTVKAGMQDLSCDYLAHLYGFVKFSELRIDKLETLVDEVDAYKRALTETIKQGKAKIDALEKNDITQAFKARLNTHPDNGICGKNCFYSQLPVHKPLPTPPVRPAPAQSTQASARRAPKPLPTPPAKH